VSEYQIITPPLRFSHRPVEEPTRRQVRVGAVQQRWREDPARHRGALADGYGSPPERVHSSCLQELTVHPYR
jgi:hypothetical protein